MELLILRHGKAEDEHPKGDFDRALVDKGYRQSRAVAALLKRAGILPDVVLTSPRVRARQTAETFCEAAGLPGPVLQGWIDCGMDPEGAIRELVAFCDFERVMIVGHEPDLSGLIEWLLGCSGSGVEMKKGGLACLEVHPPSWHARLKFLVPPRLA